MNHLQVPSRPPASEIDYIAAIKAVEEMLLAPAPVATVSSALPVQARRHPVWLEFSVYLAASLALGAWGLNYRGDGALIVSSVTKGVQHALSAFGAV